MIMDTAMPEPAPERQPRSRKLTVERTTEILWETAIESAIGALLILVLGSVAIGLVSGIMADMTPTLPPALAGKPTAEAVPPPWAGLQEFFHQYQFAIVFGVLFVGKTAGRLIRYSPRREHRFAGAWFERMVNQVSENWMGLIVINAFTAWVTAMVISWCQNFSWVHWIWAIALNLCQPVFHTIVGWFPANPAFDLIGNTFGWYNDNQFKFTFWLVYTAAICDDLGIPNLKTLSLRIWHRVVYGKGVPVAISQPVDSVE